MVPYVYVSHGRVATVNTRTDFDAVASIALMWSGALRKNLRRGIDFEIDMIDYYSDGIDALTKYRDTSIFLADIPPEALTRDDNGSKGSNDTYENNDSLSRFRRSLEIMRANRVRFNFIDHHPVSRRTKLLFEQYVNKGLIETSVLSRLDQDSDRTTPISEKKCSAEMILEMLEHRFHVNPDDDMKRLARYAHDQDFGIRRIPEANKLSTVIGADYDPERLAETLACGEFWSDELETAYHAQVEKSERLLGELKFERRQWRLKSGKVISVVYALLPQEALKVTVAGIHCIEEKGARVAVLVSRNGFLSLRIVTDEKELHAGAMLSGFGGGGHQGAASAGGNQGAGPSRSKSRLPYRYANDDNFGEVVDMLDDVLTLAADVVSV